MRKKLLLPLLLTLLISSCGVGPISSSESSYFSSSEISSIESSSSSSEVSSSSEISSIESSSSVISSSQSSISSSVISSSESSISSSSSGEDKEIISIACNRTKSDINALVFYYNETFTTTGLVIEGTYPGGVIKDVTKQCSFSNTDIIYDDVNKGKYIDVVHTPSGLSCKYWISITIPSEEDLEVTSISISPLTIQVGHSDTAVANVLPSKTYWKEVIWSVNDSSIASVDESGVVTGNKVGSVTLTATSKKFSKKSGSTTVTITEGEVDHGTLKINKVNEIEKDIAFKERVYYKSLHKVTIKCKAIDVVSYIKTSAEDGGNPNATKVLVVDDTGYMLVSCTNGDNFGSNVKKYLEKPSLGSTYYTITGYLARYRGILELQVDSYAYSKTALVTYDLSNISEAMIGFNSMISYIEKVNPNTKGICAGKLIKTEAYCVRKVNDNNNYFFQDDNGVTFCVYVPYSLSFVSNKKYSLIGLLSLHDYNMSLRAVESKLLTGEKTYNIESKAVECVIEELYDYLPPEGSVVDKDYIAAKSNFFTTRCYVGAYIENNKYDYCFSDTCYLVGDNSYSIASKKADVISANGVWSSNDNYWNVNPNYVTKGVLSSYCLDFYYIYSDEELDAMRPIIYFTLDLINTDTGVKNTSSWKISILEDMTYAKINTLVN